MSLLLFPSGAAAEANYTNLISAVGAWMGDRSDLAVQAPSFISLAEARLRRELRDWLRTTIVVDDVVGDYELTAEVDAVMSVALNDGAGGVYNAPLNMLNYQDYHAKMACDSTIRQPVRAVYVDRDEVQDTTTLRWYPPVSAASPLAHVSAEVVGYLPSLTDNAPTNRLLIVAPDLYLNATLCEASSYLQHDERVPGFQQRAAEAIKGLQLQTERRVHGGQPRPVKFPVVFG